MGDGQVGVGTGRAYAMAFASETIDTRYGAGAWYPSLLLHEVTHNLGAVADDAPNSSGAGHCRQTQDVMCYDDGGPKVRQLGMVSACEYPADTNGPVGSWYDCGGEDYFNPAPAPGSWLAANPAANVYDSMFMGTCAELTSSCARNQFDGADRDNDGVEDRLDACPDSPAGSQTAAARTPTGTAAWTTRTRARCKPAATATAPSCPPPPPGRSRCARATSVGDAEHAGHARSRCLPADRAGDTQTARRALHDPCVRRRRHPAHRQDTRAAAIVRTRQTLHRRPARSHRQTSGHADRAGGGAAPVRGRDGHRHPRPRKLIRPRALAAVTVRKPV